MISSTKLSILEILKNGEEGDKRIDITGGYFDQIVELEDNLIAVSKENFKIEIYEILIDSVLPGYDLITTINVGKIGESNYEKLGDMIIDDSKRYLILFSKLNNLRSPTGIYVYYWDKDKIKLELKVTTDFLELKLEQNRIYFFQFLCWNSEQIQFFGVSDYGNIYSFIYDVKNSYVIFDRTFTVSSDLTNCLKIEKLKDVMAFQVISNDRFSSEYNIYKFRFV